MDATPRLRVVVEDGESVVVVPHGQTPLGTIASARSRMVQAEDGDSVWELVLAPQSGAGAESAPALAAVEVAWEFSVEVPERVRSGHDNLDGALTRLRPGAYVLLTRQSPRPGVLLSHLRLSADLWTLPGGGIDPGESPEEAVRREVFEETGLHFEPDGLLGVYSHRYVGYAPDGTLEDFQILALVYTGRVDERADPQVTEIDGSTDVSAWIPFADLPSTRLTPVATAILERWGPPDTPRPVVGITPRGGPAARPS